MMQRKMVLRVTSKLLIPPIMLFALYVQFHGDFGPGGGFQAGVIFGAAFILNCLIFGVAASRDVISASVSRFTLAFGVILYTGVGIASIILGGNFLDYSVLAHDPLHGQHYGILLIELGVGITVASAMITIFYTFVTRAITDEEELVP
jgi:multicomponent Na+:H+ antiporter subunit B